MCCSDLLAEQTLTSEAMQMVTSGTHHNCDAFMNFQDIQMAKTHHQHFSPLTAGLCFSVLRPTEINNRSCRTQSNPPTLEEEHLIHSV